MPDRIETIDEYYNQKFLIIDCIRKLKVNPVITNYIAPNYVNIDITEPIENAKSRKCLIKSKELSYLFFYCDDFDFNLIYPNRITIHFSNVDTRSSTF